MESQQFVVLTDKDSAEVEPIMKMIATIDEYHRSVHMLFVCSMLWQRSSKSWCIPSCLMIQVETN